MSRRLLTRAAVASVLALAAAGLVVEAMPVVARTAPHSVFAATSSSSSAASTRVKQLAGRLVAALKPHYQVAQGYPRLYTTADCYQYSYRIMHSCFANNPAAPYVFPIVPSWPGEYIDPALRNAFGKTGNGYSATYRFDRREAVVIFGVMPPPARYLGIQTYLATHKGTFDTTSSTYQFFATKYPSFLGVLFAKVPHDPSRIQSFSSLGNSTNNVVMQRKSGGPFGQLRAFVITPDQTINGAVRRALARVGIPGKDVFTEPVASKGFRLGLDRSADDFLTVIRYAMPNSTNAADAWRKTLPLAVLRVRERPASPRAPKPYPVPVLDPRTASPEGRYSGDLNNLVSAVCLRWGSCTNRTSLIDGQAPPVNAVGPICRPIGMNCLADTQDTTYGFSTDLTLDHHEIYAIASTLATETGNATYVGIGINESTRLLGVANIDDSQLQGSAASYTGVHNTDKLFVYYLTRDCTGLQALTRGRCLSISTKLVPEDHSFKITQRTYIKPGTERGPDSTQLLTPIVVRVARPQP